MFVSASARIVDANEKARLILSLGDGLSETAGVLQCGDAATTAQLNQSFRSLLDDNNGTSHGHSLLVQRPSGLPPYTLSLHATPVASSREDHCFMVLLHDPCSDKIRDCELLCDAFGLTAAEANLVIALEQGETTVSYAKHHTLSMPTVRTHLQRAFQKLGVNRQADLVRIVSAFWRHSV